MNILQGGIRADELPQRSCDGSSQSCIAQTKGLSPLGRRQTALLATSNMSKRFASDDRSITVFKKIDLSVDKGEFVSLVGPSGCGKTTLLLCLAGLLPLSEGQINFKGQVVRSPPKGVAVVFQDYSRTLFPWKRIVDNVIFGMRRISELSKKERVDIAVELLAAVGLAGFERHYPWQLSGGMQQRVAIARALASRSDLVLFDEPFASLDAQTRTDMQELVLQLFKKFDQTCILVTHDIEEALYLGTRVCVLSAPPSSIILDVPIDLPWPRDQLATKEDRTFLALRHQVLSLIRRPTGNTGSTLPINNNG